MSEKKDILIRQVEVGDQKKVKEIAKGFGISLSFVNKKLIENGYKEIIEKGIDTIHR